MPSQTMRIASILSTVLMLGGCDGAVGGGPGAVWDDDAEDGVRSTMFKHPPPPGPAPWTYILTTYGAPNDTSCTGNPPACGGTVVDGTWWYATGAWSFGCFSKLQLRANGRCAVVNVVDNGPAAWVEDKARDSCGVGQIIDASPLVIEHLFSMPQAGWSDCFEIQVSPVDAGTPTGPCSSESPPQPPGQDCHDSAPFSWDHCSLSCPCGAGEGDCDSDADCQSGLHCEHNAGDQYGAGSTVDICVGSENNAPGDECHGTTPMDWNYCSNSCPCGEGQGDCDSDGDCQPGLRCSPDVGDSYGVDSTVDVCERSEEAQPPGGGQCAHNGGTNYRQCRECGWQFCLPDDTWSGDCDPKPEAFPCPAGQVCGGDAWCH